jgi:hypothetical protein
MIIGNVIYRIIVPIETDKMIGAFQFTGRLGPGIRAKDHFQAYQIEQQESA